MLLQDEVAAATEPLRVARPDGSVHDLPNCLLIKTDVQTASLRYVLSDDVAASVCRAAFGAPQRLARCFDLLRLPAPSVWLEWNEKGRRAALAELGIVDPASAGRTTQRAGMLVRSDVTGRRGEIFCVWAAPEGPPDISPFVIHFDLDDATYHSRSDSTALARAVGFWDSEELSWLLAHARFDLHDAWCRYYLAASRSPAEFESVLDQNMGFVSSCLPLMAAFCLLLVARDAVDKRPSDLQRLNIARRKRGRSPLLDYVEVVPYALGLSAVEAAMRAKARLHYVTGHFVRRSATIYWRRAHLRGQAAD